MRSFSGSLCGRLAYVANVGPLHHPARQIFNGTVRTAGASHPQRIVARSPDRSAHGAAALHGWPHLRPAGWGGAYVAVTGGLGFRVGRGACPGSRNRSALQRIPRPLTAIAIDHAHALTRHGFTLIVLLSTHGGNRVADLGDAGAAPRACRSCPSRSGSRCRAGT